MTDKVLRKLPMGAGTVVYKKETVINTSDKRPDGPQEDEQHVVDDPFPQKVVDDLRKEGYSVSEGTVQKMRDALEEIFPEGKSPEEE